MCACDRQKASVDLTRLLPITHDTGNTRRAQGGNKCHAPGQKGGDDGCIIKQKYIIWDRRYNNFKKII